MFQQPASTPPPEGAPPAKTVEPDSRRPERGSLWRWLPLLAALGLAAAGGAGCTTLGGDSETPAKDLATVTVTAPSAAVITDTVASAMRSRGYVAVSDGFKHVICSKQASKTSNLLYGGWPGLDPPIQEEVQIYLETIGTNQFTLHLDAYRITGAGQAMMEEKKPVARTRGGAYQKMLNEIAKNIPAAAPPSAPPPAVTPPPS